MKGGYPLRIDFHTHVFPDKLAEKALTSISEHTGAPYFTNGTVADTDEKLKEWNVDSSVALHIATNPKQQYNVNTWDAGWYQIKAIIIKYQEFEEDMKLFNLMLNNLKNKMKPLLQLHIDSVHLKKLMK